MAPLAPNNAKQAGSNIPADNCDFMNIRIAKTKQNRPMHPLPTCLLPAKEEATSTAYIRRAEKVGAYILAALSDTYCSTNGINTDYCSVDDSWVLDIPSYL